jgi:hypothetical protein
MNKPVDINKSHSGKQSELYETYMLSISDEREKLENIVKILSKECEDAVDPLMAAYMEAIKPEYDETAEIINPKVAKLKADLEKIRIRATKQTNDKLATFGRWQDEVLGNLMPRIAERQAVFDSLVAPHQKVRDEAVEKAQKALEEKTKPAYEDYVKKAEELEKAFVADTSLKASKKTGKWDIKSDQIIEAKRAEQAEKKV